VAALTQIRVQLALPQLPPAVQRQGVNVQMKAPGILLAVDLISPDHRYDTVYPSNYAEINIYDELSRLSGVGLVNILGQRAYSMWTWLEPTRLAALDMTAGEVVQAIRDRTWTWRRATWASSRCRRASSISSCSTPCAG
jgi:multidrug efflux pump subunit AcrB